MNILMLFATNSGATEMVVNTISQLLVAANNRVTVKNPKDSTFDFMQSADLILLSSPSWDFGDKQGQPHQDFLTLFAQLEGKLLTGKKFAVVGLGDSSYSVFCGSADHLEDFVRKLQGELVIETLRIDGYYFDQDKNEQLVKDWTNTLVQKLSSTG